MDEDRRQLLRRFGYEGPLEAPATRALAARGGPALSRDALADPNYVPPIDEAGLDQLERLLDNEPSEMVAVVQRAMDRRMTEADVRRLIQQTRQALHQPRAVMRAIDASLPIDLGPTTLPADFTFDGFTDTIEIDPGDVHFETLRDSIGWALNSGYSWIRTKLGLLDKAPFPWAEKHASNFVYNLAPRDGDKLSVALWADFGTGLYHSRYIARHIIRRAPTCAVHLGDVYYSGTAKEFESRFAGVLKDMLEVTEVFAIPGNHEMMAGGFPFFDYVKAKREASAAVPQRQEGSYLCLRASGLQIVAIDTEYHRSSRLTEPALVQWLETRLREGRAAGLVNILLTSDEPYDLGEAEPAPLLSRDLAPIVGAGLVDLWFWGNTHYCALYDRSDATPFIGSCIGHAGYPYLLSDLKDRKRSMTRVVWLETEPRFPRETGVRQDAGNNGFVMLTPDDGGGLVLDYVDWMNRPRHRATLRRDAAGRLVL